MVIEKELTNDRELTFLHNLDKKIQEINPNYAWASANKKFYDRFRYNPMDREVVIFPNHAGYSGIVYRNGKMQISG